ncbi:MAG TPA: EAL domain-containing protein [Solirubrobacterales bacterium]|nr:EAL domain-containing protein [Solirubrobacterales bacterium]
MADVRGTGPRSEGRGAGARRRDWSRRIEEALREDLFVLHAQRIVDVATGETVRHELFLRMVVRDGLIPAGEFVLAAEELGSIREIDRWVAGRAIEVAAAGHPVDLNLSVRSADDELLELIRLRIQGAGADPAYIVLELSEEQLVADLAAGEGFVRGAHELGCRIALDGFIQGGRRSALLKGRPIDFVKLGPRFVNGLAADGRRRRKARNAAAKAHASRQKVIAQGVEDLITLELLPDLGIDEAQGYALGRPEPLESVFPAPA